MQGNRTISGLSANQVGVSIEQSCGALQKQYASMAQAMPHAVGVSDLIARAHDEMSLLQEAILALEKRLDVVLQPPYDGAGAGLQNGEDRSTDALAVEQLRDLIARICGTAANVNQLHTRVQV